MADRRVTSSAQDCDERPGPTLMQRVLTALIGVVVGVGVAAVLRRSLGIGYAWLPAACLQQALYSVGRSLGSARTR